mmetsp:Transcript_53673/g.100593  ORF Transcript_53673/g.100593 Transcript_53673/m.100593 type:complete len:161 (+) Transcript_53673:32-514(+)
MKVDTVFQTSSILSFLLYLKYFTTNQRWGLLKGNANMRAPEDFINNPDATADDVEAANAAGRIVQNDLENIPFGLVFMWASALCILGAQVAGKDVESSCLAHVVLSVIFFTARVLHTVVYSVLKVFVLRAVLFFVGTSALLGLGIVSMVEAFHMSSEGQR